MKKNCKYCSEEFNARRKNHVYCCLSCKTLASYKRNNYKYVSGHYQKDNSLQIKKANSLKSTDNKFDERSNSLELKKERINLNSVSNSALGTAASDSITFGLKKVFAPNTLPATKGDIKKLTDKIFKRYHQVINVPRRGDGAIAYFDMETGRLTYSTFPL